MRIEKIVKNIAVKKPWTIDKVELVGGGFGFWKHAAQWSVPLRKGEFAYRCSRFLGLNVVPRTVEASYDGQVGLLKRWVDGAILNIKIQGDVLRQMQLIALYDLCTNNYDRWANNIMVDGNRDLWATDNDTMFMPYPSMSPAVRSLFAPWGRQTVRAAKYIVEIKHDYLDFAMDWIEEFIDSPETRTQIYNAVRSNIGVIKHGLDLIGRSEGDG